MSTIDNKGLPSSLDKERMISVLDRFPDQCASAIERGEGFKLLPKQRIDKVVVCGMGGSAVAGDLVKRFSRVPFFTNRSYIPPVFADRYTLLVAISYSGNTAETLSSLARGIEAGASILVIASGGQLERISNAQDLPFLKIPSGYQPRAAMGHLALPLLATLSRVGLLKEIGPWDALLAGLAQVRDRCTLSIPVDEKNPAKRLAETLAGHVPIVYGTVDNTDVVAMRFKTQFNENAKQPAFWNVFPELNHNELVALVRADLLPNQHVLLLENAYDLPENRDRMEITTTLLEKSAVPFTRVSADGESELAQVFSQIYFGDYVSYYLAICNGVDPTPVEPIEEFKKALAERDDH